MQLTTVTAQQIINLALRDAGVLGVGQTALAEDVNDALLTLNMMISQWNRKRFMVWHLVDVSIVSTGAISYSFGPEGDFPIDLRPDAIESAFVRIINGPIDRPFVDQPLTIIPAKEDYNRIRTKFIGTYPSHLYYDPAYPLGRLYFWPIPQASLYQLFVTVKYVLGGFQGLGTTVSFPPEYLAALRYGLAQRLAPMYGLPVTPALMGLAKDAFNVIRNSNTQIAQMKLPVQLSGRGRYNVYTDGSN